MSEAIRVLAVDDNPDFAEMIATFLPREDERFEIDTATSAVQALEYLDENDYDAIISDYEMPKMDGLDLLETIRAERDSDIPFIIFTGKSRETVAIESLNLGADRYLQKRGDPASQYSVLAQATLQEIDHHRAGTELDRKSTLLDSILENTPISIYIKDLDGQIVSASDIYKQRAADLGVEDPIGLTDFDILPSEEEARQAAEEEERIIETGEPMTDERIAPREDGPDLVVRTVKAPLFDKDDSVMGIVGFTHHRKKQKADGSVSLPFPITTEHHRETLEVIAGHLERLHEDDLPENVTDHIEDAIDAITAAREAATRQSDENRDPTDS